MNMKNIEIYVEFKELVSIWPLKHLSKYSYSYFNHFMYFPEVPKSLASMVEVMAAGLEVKGSVILASSKEYSVALKIRALRHDILSSKERKRRNRTI